MLRFLDEHSIRPGAQLRVLRAEPFGGGLIVRVAGGEECSIGPELAERMLIEPVG